MSQDQMTPEQAAALANYLGIGSNRNLSGTSQISAVENLAGLSDNLLAQALLGYLNAEDIGVIVQGLMYEPYEGQDPLLAQQEINVALRAVGENLGLAPETLNELALSVAGGTPADVALATISGSIFRGEEGGSLVDVPQADAKDFDLLGSLLSEYGKAARLESNLVDFGGQKYSMRSDADVRKDMADLGLTGEFNDPSAWVFQPDQTLQKAAEETGARAQSEQQNVESLMGQLAQFERLGGTPRVPVVGGSPLYEDPNVTSGIVRFFEDMQKSDRDTYDRMRDQGLETGSGTSFIDLAGAATPGEPLSSALDNAPALQATSAESDLLKRQQEEAIKSANRYATFAAAEEARKQAAPRMDDIRSQIIQASAEQNLLSSNARKLAQDAVDEGSYAGDQMISNFRDFIASSLPSQTKQVSGGPARISLSDELVRSAARTAAAPYLRLRGR